MIHDVYFVTASHGDKTVSIQSSIGNNFFSSHVAMIADETLINQLGYYVEDWVEYEKEQDGI